MEETVPINSFLSAATRGISERVTRAGGSGIRDVSRGKVTAKFTSKRQSVK